MSSKKLSRGRAMSKANPDNSGFLRKDHAPVRADEPHASEDVENSSLPSDRRPPAARQAEDGDRGVVQSASDIGTQEQIPMAERFEN